MKPTSTVGPIGPRLQPTQYLNHTLPLTPNEGRRAALHLPADLSQAEALRLCAFITSLALPDDKATS